MEIASIDHGTRCDPDGRVRHADGTIRDTGVREGPINTKNTALRMIFQNGCSDPLARGTVYTGAPPDCQNFAQYYPAGVNRVRRGTRRTTGSSTPTWLPCWASRARRRTSRRWRSSTRSPTAASAAQATTSGGSPQGPLISLTAFEDLGVVTFLWKQPKPYADYLGAELSMLYKERVLVVMPNGYGIYRLGHSGVREQRLLERLRSPRKPSAMLPRAIDAVRRLAAAQGIELALPDVQPPAGRRHATAEPFRSRRARAEPARRPRTASAGDRSDPGRTAERGVGRERTAVRRAGPGRAADGRSPDGETHRDTT